MELQTISQEKKIAGPSKPPVDVPELHITSPTGCKKRIGVSGLDLYIPSAQDHRLSRQSYATTISPCSLRGPLEFPTKHEPVWGIMFYFRLSHLVIASICSLLHALSMPHAFDHTVQAVAEDKHAYNCSIVAISQSLDKLLCRAIFPYIAFASHIIISAVNLLGCILSQPMPPLLNRAFCLIGGATFLTAAGVNFYRWPTHILTTEEEIYFSASPIETMIASACLALFGAVLYWVEAYLSFRESVKQIEALAPVCPVSRPPSITARQSLQRSPTDSSFMDKSAAQSVEL